MRLYRCFSPDADSEGQHVVLEEAEARHLASARRIRVGEEALVLNGRGGEFLAAVRALEKRSATLEIRRVERNETGPPPARELACALTKSSTYDEMVQRAVELGMTVFRPIYTERTVVELDQRRAQRKTERWRKLAVEALKQCERVWLPRVEDPVHLADALQPTARREFPIALVGRLYGVPPLARFVTEKGKDGICLYVGPEGGWTDGEIDLFGERGAAMASLGNGVILRTETAALAAMAIAMPVD